MGPQNKQFGKDILVDFLEGGISKQIPNKMNKNGNMEFDHEEHFESTWTEEGEGFRYVKDVHGDDVGNYSPGLINNLEADTSIPMTSGFILSEDDCQLKYSYEDNMLTLLTNDSVTSIEMPRVLADGGTTSEISDRMDKITDMLSERFTTQIIVKIHALVYDYSLLRHDIEEKFKKKNHSEEVLKTLTAVMKAGTAAQTSEQLSGLIAEIGTYNDYFESILDEEDADMFRSLTSDEY